MTTYNQMTESEKEHVLEVLREEMLESVPSDLNKSELSPVSIAIAPAAAQNIETRIYADNIMDSTMVDTALGEDLTRKCAEHGVNRFPSTASIRLGVFEDFNEALTDTPIGSVFGIDGIIFTATEKISAGHYKMACELPGEVGNNYTGAILPIDNLSLGSAELTDVIVPGEDEENDEDLRTRYYRIVNSRPFGGNVAQYYDLFLSFKGVGDAKIFPVPNNEGGRVHGIIIGPPNSPVLSPEFIKSVEDEIDPNPKGKGYGEAPIDHYVTVSTVTQEAINIQAVVYLSEGQSINSVSVPMKDAIIAYLSGLVFKDNIVRVARIEREILGVEGVVDVSSTSINGVQENITLPASYNDYRIPVLGTLDITEG